MSSIAASDALLIQQEAVGGAVELKRPVPSRDGDSRECRQLLLARERLR